MGPPYLQASFQCGKTGSSTQKQDVANQFSSKAAVGKPLLKFQQQPCRDQTDISSKSGIAKASFQCGKTGSSTQKQDVANQFSSKAAVGKPLLKFQQQPCRDQTDTSSKSGIAKASFQCGKTGSSTQKQDVANQFSSKAAVGKPLLKFQQQPCRDQTDISSKSGIAKASFQCGKTGSSTQKQDVANQFSSKAAVGKPLLKFQQQPCRDQTDTSSKSGIAKASFQCGKTGSSTQKQDVANQFSSKAAVGKPLLKFQQQPCRDQTDTSSKSGIAKASFQCGKTGSSTQKQDVANQFSSKAAVGKPLLKFQQQPCRDQTDTSSKSGIAKASFQCGKTGSSTQKQDVANQFSSKAAVGKPLLKFQQQPCRDQTDTSSKSGIAKASFQCGKTGSSTQKQDVANQFSSKAAVGKPLLKFQQQPCRGQTDTSSKSGIAKVI
ncbi:hypothetical protein BDR26DRAFT_946769 [Obelidium mucronatum]|nr:hypothetical protein BDR26DRAFT_946769 [Obelidium mucronatum]